jgi:Myb/SANT-like DNA-binding domain
LKKFPEKRFDKDKIKNHIKCIKKGFGSCYGIFKNGFSWDPVKNMWGAELEVWDKLVEVIIICMCCAVSL